MRELGAIHKRTAEFEVDSSTWDTPVRPVAPATSRARRPALGRRRSWLSVFSLKGTHEPDYWLLVTLAALIVFGTVMVFSATFAINLPDGGSYKGIISNGKPNGKGKLVFHDLNYEGDFLNGKRHGNGVQSWTSGLHQGESYVGEWKNDERDGYGIHTWPDGRKYTGEWKTNRQNKRRRYCS